MKTSELTGAALDYAVLVAKGTSMSSCAYFIEKFGDDDRRDLCEKFSSDWNQGGPIIEQEFIELRPGSYTGKDRLWAAWTQNGHGDSHSRGKTGPTALIAAMRAFVASKLGDEADVPEELL